ncbi:hypothetical protein cypCar_00042941 [Cyprinus carpio]|nr:hypothetical protein cypCar_00042941 [Cyprinus carpio]
MHTFNAITEPLRRHKRSWIIDSFDIVEEHLGPFPYDLGQIKLDRSYLVEFMLKGKGVDEDPKGVLSIDPKTGVIKVHRKVDYEQYSVLMLTFQARNKSNLAVDTQLGMEVNILDINDNPPVFQRKVYDVTIEEATKQDFASAHRPSGSTMAPISFISAVAHQAAWLPRPSGSALVCRRPAIASGLHSSGCTLSICPTDSIGLLPPSSSTLVLCRSGSTAAFRIPAYASVACAICSTLALRPLSVALARGFIVGVLAIDKDAAGTPNSTIDYKITSVTPTTKNVEFYMQKSGAISFKGCFDYEPLDFEEKAEQKLTIFVENEESYFSCEVKERSADGLWTIITNPAKPSSRDITITVEDANDPPFFLDPVRKVILEENGVVGAFVDKVTAVDPDTGRRHKLEYSIDQEPAGWFRVDKTTGEIFVKESLDRESSHVTNGTYTVTVLVTEKDDHPPMTSTATIQIYIEDKNDNVPLLKENMISLCQSDEVSHAEITAFDLDGDPYSGPFSFEIVGDHKKEWSFDPSHGTTVHLVKDKSVHTSLYTLIVKISDKQGRVLHLAGGAHEDDEVPVSSATRLYKACSRRLHSIQCLEKELLDYEPQLYALEDNPDHFVDLDPIDLPMNEFDPEQLSDLGPAFKHLASLCSPETMLKPEAMKNRTR